MDELTNYELWQIEQFGNILTGSDQQPTEIENTYS